MLKEFKDFAMRGNVMDLAIAVIIGGASFLGGRGHIGHALIGAVMIGVIRNALNLLNVDVFFQMIAIGVLLLGPAGESFFASTEELGLTLLWIAAIVTLYTGYDYFRAGFRHLLGQD